MKYSLRSLMIVVALGPPLLAAGVCHPPVRILPEIIGGR